MWLGDCWGCKGRNGVVTIWPEFVNLVAFWSVGFQEGDHAA
jgi:hypothetical protein